MGYKPPDPLPGAPPHSIFFVFFDKRQPCIFFDGLQGRGLDQFLAKASRKLVGVPCKSAGRDGEAGWEKNARMVSEKNKKIRHPGVEPGYLIGVVKGDNRIHMLILFGF
jgi:hypothetical protein